MGTRYNRLSEAVLTSIHNLCFGAKNKKKVYPCKPQFYYIKVGCKGVFVTQTCFRDDTAVVEGSLRYVQYVLMTSSVNPYIFVLQLLG